MNDEPIPTWGGPIPAITRQEACAGNVRWKNGKLQQLFLILTTEQVTHNGVIYQPRTTRTEEWRDVSEQEK
jgi:hypothetical protein